MDDETREDALKLWNYMVIDSEPCSCEAMVVLGSIDDRVAEYAAILSKSFTYQVIVFSGGQAHVGDMLQTAWSETEAEHFYKVFENYGGRAGKVLFEKQAQNTGQNALFSYNVLKAAGMADPHSLQIVTKPYMLRRAKATFEAQWPCRLTRFHVAGPDISFDGYPNESQSFETFVNIMVGDFQRMVEYPKLNLQSEQAIPDETVAVWRKLVAKGYNKHLIATK